MLSQLLVLAIVLGIFLTTGQPLDQTPLITPDNVATLTLQTLIDTQDTPFQLLAFGQLPDLVSARYADEICCDSGVMVIDNVTSTLQYVLLNATAIAFSPDGTRVAIVAPDNEMTVFDTQTGEMLASILLADREERIFNVAIDPANTYVAVAVGGGELITTADAVFYVVDIQTSQIVISMPRETQDTAQPFGTGVAFSPDGTQVLLATSDGLIRRWNLGAGTMEVAGHAARPGGCDWRNLWRDHNTLSAQPARDSFGV